MTPVPSAMPHATKHAKKTPLRAIEELAVDDGDEFELDPDWFWMCPVRSCKSKNVVVKVQPLEPEMVNALERVPTAPKTGTCARCGNRATLEPCLWFGEPGAYTKE